MSGHLFIVQGDLTRLHCDAWLLPTDRDFYMVDYWIPPHLRDQIKRVNSRVYAANLVTTQAWLSEDTRVMYFEDWPGVVKPWLANVGGSAEHTPEWFAVAARQFVEQAARANRRSTDRERPLLAVPAIGTGYGGHWRKKAGVIECVMREIRSAQETLDVDVAFVAFDGPTFAAAQEARRKLEGGTLFHGLSERLREHGDRIAERAAEGELVLFIGAGVSRGAGLPLWTELLEQLAESAGLNADELDALKRMDAMDQGLVIERRLGGRPELETEISRLLTRNHHSLSHSLLAVLPTDSVVTLNYDTLFELASEPIVGEIAVLPADQLDHVNRWLLKLHGCIVRGDMVLTREDYLRFGDRAAALAGIVQALLITRHMLFVGFGLTDLNFMRILDDVRKALNTSGKSVAPIGTVLNLRPEPLRDALWQDDLRILTVADDSETAIDAAARTLEIFLDYVAFKSAGRPAHIMDSNFDGLLNDAERQFRDELERLHQRFERPMQGTQAWAEFEKLLETLGFGQTPLSKRKGAMALKKKS